MNPIGWCDKTWNPIIGCSHISPGCDNCYAEKMANRLAAMHNEHYQAVVSNDKFWTGGVRLIESMINKPFAWKKPRKIFVCSMGDFFHTNVPNEWRDSVLDTVILCPQHEFMILTKRAEIMHEYMKSAESRFFCRLVWPPQNLTLGVTAEDQTRADDRIPRLLNTRAAKRFVSIEPMLVPVAIIPAWLRDLDLVIVGGETGPGARPMRSDWVRNVRDQCIVAGVPFWFKKWGDHGGRNKSRLLDGREWNGEVE